MEEHRYPLAVLLAWQSLHEPHFFVVAEVADSPARFSQHLQLGYRIRFGLAIADGYVVDVL